MTPFRKTQAYTILAGVLRSLAPHISVEVLRDVAELLVHDRALWLELELLHHQLSPAPRVRTVELPPEPDLAD